MWVPLFYFLRRALAPRGGGGSVWALILGSAVVVAQFFAGPFVEPGAFGPYRWASGFVDVVSGPVLVPLILYLLFVEMGLVSAKSDYAAFALLWLVPLSAFRAMDWISPPAPHSLVLVPVLWTSLAVGIPEAFAFAKRNARLAAPAALAMLALPFAAATSWWAFYSHRPAAGFLFLAASAAPMLASLAASFAALLRGRCAPAPAAEAPGGPGPEFAEAEHSALPEQGLVLSGQGPVPPETGRAPPGPEEGGGGGEG